MLLFTQLRDPKICFQKFFFEVNTCFKQVTSVLDITEMKIKFKRSKIIFRKPEFILEGNVAK